MASEDPWEIESLDLDGYLARLGVPARPPSRAALDELHEAHVRTFTFDNIDVLLGDHPGVGLAAVQGKFVGRGRGGYCFEHSTLFAAAAGRRPGEPTEHRPLLDGEPPERLEELGVPLTDDERDRLLEVVAGFAGG